MYIESGDDVDFPKEVFVGSGFVEHFLNITLSEEQLIKLADLIAARLKA